MAATGLRGFVLRGVNLAIAALLFFGFLIGLEPALGPVAAGLAIVSAVAWLWVSEALHVSVTALLVPLLAAIAGVLPFDEGLKQFADPVIFLFLGGFALAAGLHRQGLDRLMAGWVIARAGHRLGQCARWLFWLTALLSMWISNTATAAMMLPLALGLLSPLAPDQYRRTYAYVLLGVAFSANIGGIGTLVGSPPNAIAAANVGLDFVGWLWWGLPLVLVLMPLMELALRWSLKPDLQVELAPPPRDGQVWGQSQFMMLMVFVLTVGLWIFGAPLAAALGIGRGFDAAVALFALFLLHLLRLASWADVEKSAEWGVLLLFGGGLTLSRVLTDSGAAAWLSSQLGGPLEVLPALVCLGLMILFAMLITEVTSNTASAALLVPLFIELAPGIDNVPVAVLVAAGASCAFLLPVATPPNAIVFGSGHVPQREMIRSGLGVSAFAFPVLLVAGALALVF